MIYLLLALASVLAWWLISLIIPMPLALVVIPLLLLLIALTSSAIDPGEKTSIQGNTKEQSTVDERDVYDGLRRSTCVDVKQSSYSSSNNPHHDG
jgi:hypothetical protein